MTLFQENIFGTSASLTCGPHLQLQIVSFVIDIKVKIIYSMYRADEVSVHRACCEWLPNPTGLEGEIRFIQAQDQQVPT